MTQESQWGDSREIRAKLGWFEGAVSQMTGAKLEFHRFAHHECPYESRNHITMVVGGETLGWHYTLTSLTEALALKNLSKELPK